MSADLTVPPRLIEELERGAIDCVNLHYPGWGNTMGAAAVAIASLQARLAEAERTKAELLEALMGMLRQFARCKPNAAFTKAQRAAIDAATQETPT